MKRIALATNNPHKLLEFQEILGPLGYEVVSPKTLGIVSDPAENGKDYHENSYIKALSLAKLSGLPTIADDSGFEVEALGGFPGLRSARFCEECGGSYEKAGLALNEMLGDKDRKAHFHCTICYLPHPDDEPLYFDGNFPGYLLPASSGKAGFGYDPFFHSEELNLDMGLASEEQKNAVSHRAKALKKLVSYLGKSNE